MLAAEENLTYLPNKLYYKGWHIQGTSVRILLYISKVSIISHDFLLLEFLR